RPARCRAVRSRSHCSTGRDAGWTAGWGDAWSPRRGHDPWPRREWAPLAFYFDSWGVDRAALLWALRRAYEYACLLGTCVPILVRPADKARACRTTASRDSGPRGRETPENVEKAPEGKQRPGE